MRILFGLAAIASVGALAACNPANLPTPQQTTAVPSTSAPAASSQMPQSVNSLPEGSTVNAPLSPAPGAVSDTPVRRGANARRNPPNSR